MPRLILIFGEALEKTMILFVIAFGVISFVLLITLFQFGWLYIQAAVAGAHVSFMSLIAMRLRGLKAKRIVGAYIAASRAELGLRIEELETHCLAGGDVSLVVNAVIAAKRVGLDLDFDRACAMDISGRDVLEEVKNALIAKDGDLQTGASCDGKGESNAEERASATE